jgi:hypothetical protein
LKLAQTLPVPVFYHLLAAVIFKTMEMEEKDFISDKKNTMFNELKRHKIGTEFHYLSYRFWQKGDFVKYWNYEKTNYVQLQVSGVFYSLSNPKSKRHIDFKIAEKMVA